MHVHTGEVGKGAGRKALCGLVDRGVADEVTDLLRLRCHYR